MIELSASAILGVLLAVISFFGKRELDNNSRKLNAIEDELKELNEAREHRNEEVNRMFSDLDKDLSDKFNAVLLQLAKLTK